VRGEMSRHTIFLRYRFLDGFPRRGIDTIVRVIIGIIYRVLSGHVNARPLDHEPRRPAPVAPGGLWDGDLARMGTGAGPGKGCWSWSRLSALNNGSYRREVDNEGRPIWVGGTTQPASLGPFAWQR
jgi:hypothetical protein